VARWSGIVIGAVLGVVVVLTVLEEITDYFGISLDAGLLAQTIFQQPQLFAVPLVAIEEAGLPLPVSGDLLITYSASHMGANVSGLLLLGIAFETAAVLGSTLLFFLSRRFGARLLRGAAGRALHLNPQRVERVEEWFRRWGIWAVVVGRQIPGFRIAVTVVAASFGMSYRRFIAGVAIAGAIWITMFETIGVLVGQQAAQLLGAHQTTGLLIFGGFFVLGSVYLLVRVSWRRFRPAAST
jgi:membrane protein DedA with SNARE-associated domain